MAAILFSMIAGIGGGVLDHLAGDNVPRAIFTGCTAFAACLTLLLLIISFVDQGRTDERS